ncbi:MAG: hypothetical protein U0869_13830 [Chloroflexota bacterium]
MDRASGRRPARTLAIAAAAAGLLAILGAPAVATAHDLGPRPEIPLPLEAFLAGAMLAVAMSFGLVLTDEGRWRARPATRVRRLPRPVHLALRAIGLLALAWIGAQLVVGGRSDGDVARLFTWVYGWVGLAIVCALIGPVWSWLDPFSTLHDLFAALGRRLGLARPTARSGVTPSALALPPSVADDDRVPAVWPAAGFFAVFVWLELVVRTADMHLVVAAYTAITLLGMWRRGRDAWRAQGETFSVWFGLLGRLAWWAPAGTPGSGLVRRQRFPDGLVRGPWDRSRLVLLAFATGATLYDGLAQTRLRADLLGTGGLVSETIALAVFLGAVAGLVLFVARHVGAAPMGAGLLPIAVGYLVAHYLTYLLLDGQKLLIALADPLQQGADVTGTAFLQPSIAWLPAVATWLIMFVAVVGGHMLGAWSGHLRPDAEGPVRRGRWSQAALVLLMVGLTTLTLWSLGQAAYAPPAGQPGPSSAPSAPPASARP